MEKMRLVLLCAVFLGAGAAFGQDRGASPEGDFEVGLNDALDGCIITKYTGSGGDVIIPAEIQGFPVREIGKEAFRGCRSLVSVAIPDGVMAIGSWAFYECRRLVSVAIPDGVTRIGEAAFAGCRSLVSVTIPDGVTQIDAWTFAYCESLVSVIIPDSVTMIGESAFWDCYSLVTVNIAPLEREWGGNSLAGCANVSPASQAALRRAGYTGGFYGL